MTPEIGSKWKGPECDVVLEVSYTKYGIGLKVIDVGSREKGSIWNLGDLADTGGPIHGWLETYRFYRVDKVVDFKSLYNKLTS